MTMNQLEEDPLPNPLRGIPDSAHRFTFRALFWPWVSLVVMGTPLQPLVGSGLEPMLEWLDWAGPGVVGPTGVGRGTLVRTACIGSENPQAAPGGCELGPARAPAGLLRGPLLVGAVGSHFLFGQGFE